MDNHNVFDGPHNRNGLVRPEEGAMTIDRCRAVELPLSPSGAAANPGATHGYSRNVSLGEFAIHRRNREIRGALWSGHG